jgi:hypothetical protein
MKLTARDLSKGRPEQPRKLASGRDNFMFPKYGLIFKYPHVKPNPIPKENVDTKKNVPFSPFSPHDNHAKICVAFNHHFNATLE